MEIIKRIWNYFFPEKKKVVIPKIYRDGILQTESKEYAELPDGKVDWVIQSKVIEQKVEKPKPHTQLFNKHQLSGKVYNVGKLRFRVRKKIGEVGEKLKYHIDII